MKKILKETIISFILSIALIFILSVVISKTHVSETIITPGIISISFISILVGGIRISKIKKQKGLINGAILGFIYMLIMYVLSSIIIRDFSLNIKSIIMIFIGILGGVLGGIIGVNLS